jgi:hypothetical protein
MPHGVRRRSSTGAAASAAGADPRTSLRHGPRVHASGGETLLSSKPEERRSRTSREADDRQDTA